MIQECCKEDMEKFDRDNKNFKTICTSLDYVIVETVTLLLLLYFGVLCNASANIKYFYSIICWL